MKINEPTENGGYDGDVFFGDPDDTTRATHRWFASHSRWVPLDANGNPAYALEAKVTSDGSEPIYQFFAYSHLPEHLQAMSKPFHDLATTLLATLPRNPERSVALRKLLEAKDAAVRARLFKEG